MNGITVERQGISPRTRSLRAAIGFAAAALLILVVPAGEGAAIYAIVVAMGVLCFAPSWLAMQAGRFDAFETINFLGVYYFICYGLGAMWSVEDPVRIAYDLSVVEFMPQAALYCLFGFAALLAGYYAPWFRGAVARKWEDVPQGPWLLVLTGVLGVVGCIGQARLSRGLWLDNRISWIASGAAQFEPFFHYAWALAWLRWFGGRTTPRERLFLFGFLVPAAVLTSYLLLTSKAVTLILATVPLAAFWYARGRLPWKTLAAVSLVFVFLVFPFYNTYRIIDPRIDQAHRVQMTADILGRWSGTEYVERSYVGFKNRMALVNSVAVVIRDVGRWVPYARGETLFFPAVAYFIPRALWPGKPAFNLGRQFGLIFRVVGPLDEHTSIAPTVPGELYWNFDLPGIVFGMALWGVALRWLYRRYGYSVGLDPVRQAIHLAVLMKLILFDGGIAGHGVGVVRILILFELLLWLSRRTGVLERRPLAPAA